MKNFKVTAKEDGKEYWISRSLAVVGIIRAIKYPEPHMSTAPKFYYLVSKRGKGCPDYVGKWNITCGYLDFDETRIEALYREIKEELGLDIAGGIKQQEIDGAPRVYGTFKVSEDDRPEHDPRQNVVFRYIVEVDYDWIVEQINNGTINTNTISRGGEGDEVDEIALISNSDLEKYEWAFNHYDILSNLKCDICGSVDYLNI